MAYNEDLGERLREKLLSDKNIAEKRMFGGVSFLLNGKMTCGVLQDNLVVKVDPADSDAFLAEPHVRPMDFTGRPMKGFLYVAPDGYASDEMLDVWVERSLTYARTLKSKPSRKKNLKPFG